MYDFRLKNASTIASDYLTGRNSVLVHIYAAVRLINKATISAAIYPHTLTFSSNNIKTSAMSKKTKSKKGQSEFGKGGEELKEKMTEVDKEWFQIQIKSLEEKLQRRNEKMKALEGSNNEYMERLGVKFE